jgi:hypothetical protein
MSAAKKSKRSKKTVKFEMSRTALVGWCFGLLLAFFWMFLLGLFVGKGITPANINFTEIKKKMIAQGIWPGSGKSVQEEQVSRAINTKKKIPLEDLEFYEKLAKKKKARLQEATPAEIPPKKESSRVVESPSPPAAATRQHPKVSEQQKTTKGTYTVQLASFKDLDSAKKFVVQLKDLKPTPTIRAVNLPDSGRWHRVQVGQLSSRAEAAALADRLAKKYKLQAFVVSLGN